MGLWELLDQACAVLTEAGYRDPWNWTPRQIMHRLSVHMKLRDQQSLVDLNIALLAARGDEKALQSFSASLSEHEADDSGHSPERETAPAPAAVAEKLAETHKSLPWSKRV